jgi:hypothetical protein
MSPSITSICTAATVQFRAIEKLRDPFEEIVRADTNPQR